MAENRTVQQAWDQLVKEGRLPEDPKAFAWVKWAFWCGAYVVSERIESAASVEDLRVVASEVIKQTRRFMGSACETGEKAGIL